MDFNPDRIVLWPGYFDSKSSRRNGRRVAKDSSVPKPDLDGLIWAARSIGLRKIKSEEKVSHPSRPHGKEGRLWVSCKGAEKDLGSGNKEEIMQMVGLKWRELLLERKNEEREATKAGPKAGDRRAKAQRKVSGSVKQAASRANASRKSHGRKNWKK